MAQPAPASDPQFAPAACGFPVRTVLELSTTQFQALTLYSTRHGMSSTEVLRAFIDHLEDHDPMPLPRSDHPTGRDLTP